MMIHILALVLMTCGLTSGSYSNPKYGCNGSTPTPLTYIDYHSATCSICTAKCVQKINQGCWEAHTPSYSGSPYYCADYASHGYTCVGDYCATNSGAKNGNDPLGTPSGCTQKPIPGSEKWYVACSYYEYMQNTPDGAQCECYTGYHYQSVSGRRCVSCKKSDCAENKGTNYVVDSNTGKCISRCPDTPKLDAPSDFSHIATCQLKNGAEYCLPNCNTNKDCNPKGDANGAICTNNNFKYKNLPPKGTTITQPIDTQEKAQEYCGAKSMILCQKEDVIIKCKSGWTADAGTGYWSDTVSSECGTKDYKVWYPVSKSKTWSAHCCSKTKQGSCMYQNRSSGGSGGGSGGGGGSEGGGGDGDLIDWTIVYYAAGGGSLLVLSIVVYYCCKSSSSSNSSQRKRPPTATEIELEQSLLPMQSQPTRNHRQEPTRDLFESSDETVVDAEKMLAEMMKEEGENKYSPPPPPPPSSPPPPLF